MLRRVIINIRNGCWPFITFCCGITVIDVTAITVTLSPTLRSLWYLFTTTLYLHYNWSHSPPSLITAIITAATTVAVIIVTEFDISILSVIPRGCAVIAAATTTVTVVVTDAGQKYRLSAAAVL